MNIARRDFIKRLVEFSTLSISGCGVSLKRPANPPELPYFSREFEYAQLNPPASLTEIQLEVNKINFEFDLKWDRWYGPKKTLMLGWGDCDDISIYACYRLEQLGYPALILDLKGIEKKSEKDSYHWIALIEHKNETGKIEYGGIEQYGNLFEEEFAGNPLKRIFKGYDSIDNLVHKINSNEHEQYKYTHYKLIDVNKIFPKNWRTTNRDLWNLLIVFELEYTKVKEVE